jgi:hypothetical protein
MKVISTALRTEQILWLKANQDLTGATMAEQIRRAIDSYRQTMERAATTISKTKRK